MQRFILAIFATTVVFGCTQDDLEASRITAPPSGQGVLVSASGADVTQFTVLGEIAFGEEKSARLSASSLSGFTFAADVGQRLDLRLNGRGHEVDMVLYGPRLPTGLWGDHLTVAARGASAHLRQWSVPQTGLYFVLLRVDASSPTEVALTLSCGDCDAPKCLGTGQCNLYCADGLVPADDGSCFLCECRGAACPLSGCSGDAQCVYACGDALCDFAEGCSDGQCTKSECDDTQCRDTEACVDGACVETTFRCVDSEQLCRTNCPPVSRPTCGRVNGRSKEFPNECYARCEGADDIGPMSCPAECQSVDDCGDNQVCVEGQCQTEGCQRCPEPRPDEALCGQDGENYRSRCLLDCANVAFAYPGPCVTSPCTNQQDCALGELCAPVGGPRRRENVERCNDDFSSPTCARECRPLPQCRPGDERCPEIEGQPLFCLPISDEIGRCVAACSPSRSAECGEGVCAPLTVQRSSESAEESESMQDGQHVCLPSCTDDTDCPGRLRCRPSVAGRNVCRPCACDLARPQRVCHRGDEFNSVCEASCDGRPFDELVPILDSEVCDGLDNDCDGSADEGFSALSERCDGRDNDCDGRIDEMVPEVVCGNDVGACETGIKQCVDGQLGACMGAITETNEMCDESDNDCDGRVDEGFDEIEETCNGLDDDCDGKTDELIEPIPCGDGVGECRAGFRRCVDGALGPCLSPSADADELCDGMDNDCDGRIDEGFDEKIELCDRIDNDCDGRTDEGFDAVEDLCDGRDNDCDGRVDEDVSRRPEICNALDDDCDGRIDERDIELDDAVCGDEDDCVRLLPLNLLVQRCGSNVGECRPGLQMCVRGQWGECFADVPKSEELCDRLDNDCDGRIDEDLPEIDLQDNMSDDELIQALRCSGQCNACPAQWAPVCSRTGQIYANRCEALCQGAEPTNLEACLRPFGDRLAFRCQADAECMRGGCDGTICGTNIPDNACYDLDDRAQCFPQNGRCRCIEGLCAFTSTDQVVQCLRDNPVPQEFDRP